nr:hypothetical protein DM860_001275 [Ipomoea trifida]
MGHSSGSSSVSMNQQQPTSFLGLRVVNNVLQFGESCGETHRESSSLFTADWTYSSGNNNNNNADSVPFLETSTDQSVNYSETVSPAGTFIPQQHQQASFPSAFCSSPYTENSSLLQGISGQGINTNEHPPPLLPGNSENLSSKQIEIEINSYGGEEDISALLDAADNDTPNNNPEEGLWDDDDDFSDILSGFTK